MAATDLLVRQSSSPSPLLSSISHLANGEMQADSSGSSGSARSSPDTERSRLDATGVADPTGSKASSSASATAASSDPHDLEQMLSSLLAVSDEFMLEPQQLQRMRATPPQFHSLSSPVASTSASLSPATPALTSLLNPATFRLPSATAFPQTFHSLGGSPLPPLSSASYGDLLGRQLGNFSPVEQSTADADKKVENLFIVALDLVRSYKRPPFDINTISNEMKRIDPTYDVHNTSYGRFLELCKHMSAKGYLYLTRIGGIPMVKAYGNGSKDRKTGHLPTMPPSRHLWVGSVGPTVTKEQLYALFGQYGVIEAVSMHTNMGYAFIDFQSTTDASAAKEHLQGAVLGDKKITINFAKGEASRSILVGNLSDVTEEQLYNEFSSHGLVEKVVLVAEQQCAYVDFVRKEDAISAFYSMQDRVLGSRRIQLDFLKTRDNFEKRMTRQLAVDQNLLMPPTSPNGLAQWALNLAQRRQQLARLKQLQATLAGPERGGAANSLSEALLVEIMRDALAEVGEVRLMDLGKYLAQRTGFSFQQQPGGLRGLLLRYSDVFLVKADLPENPAVSLRSRTPASSAAAAAAVAAAAAAYSSAGGFGDLPASAPASPVIRPRSYAPGSPPASGALGMPPLPPLPPSDAAYAHILASLGAVAGPGPVPSSPPLGPLSLSAFSTPLLSPSSSPAGPRPGCVSAPPSLSPPSSATGSPSLSPYGAQSPASPSWPLQQRVGDPQHIWASAAAAAALRQVQAQHHAAAAAAAAAAVAAAHQQGQFGPNPFGSGQHF